VYKLQLNWNLKAIHDLKLKSLCTRKHIQKHKILYIKHKYLQFIK